jgi:hypothetical protein
MGGGLAASMSCVFYNFANSRTSWLIFIEQNFGPHMLQKCAVLAPSAGSVWDK